MISRENIFEVLSDYDKDDITIGVLGGHSALDVCHGAKKYGFNTIAVVQKGRELTYSKYYKTRAIGNANNVSSNGFKSFKGVVDDVIVVDKFRDIVNPDVQEELRKRNTVFIHNRYFWVYCDFNEIENDFLVPIYGSRDMLKLEERDVPKNQYYLLQKAGIRIPKIYSSYKDIDKMVIVKVNEAIRGYERAFFVASSPDDYLKKSDEMIKAGTITKEGLEKAVIEEFIVGAQVNFNYFYSPLTQELELMGTDMRRQTNLDGLLRLTAPEQFEVLKHIKPKMVETGHVTVTVKESLVEKAFLIGEKFVEATKKEVNPGIIGPFALQGAVSAEDGKEEIVIFDVSMRIPGSPGTRYTPYSGYLYGESMSYGDRVAMEIESALMQNKLNDIVT